MASGTMYSSGSGAAGGATAPPAKRKKKRQSAGPLADRHFRQVICRKREVREALPQVWGVTWAPPAARFTEAGRAAMMVISYHPQPTDARRLRIELRCMTSRVAGPGQLAYDVARMSHDFGLNPKPRAKGRRLDPRPDGEAPLANASWVDLALQLDSRCASQAHRAFALEATPRLPEVWVGVADPARLDCPDTPALRELLAAREGVSAVELASVPAEEIVAQAWDIWADSWVAPGERGNPSHLYLIPRKLVQPLPGMVLYEDLTPVCGAEVWNPAREIRTVVFQNPVRALASRLGFPVPGEEAECGVRETAARREALREALGEWAAESAVRIPGDLLDAAISHPDREIRVRLSSVQGLPPEVVVPLMREQLQRDGRRAIAELATDAELAAAATAPRQPLHVGALPRRQVLGLPVGAEAPEAFRFSSAALERVGLTADLWVPPGWSPGRRKAKARGRR